MSSHDAKIREQFAQRIETYEHAANWMLSPELIQAQRDLIGPAQEGADQCLDLCCGTGIVGRNLLDLGWQVKGLDITPEMTWVANKHFNAKVGSVERIEMESGTFDLATLRQSFMLVNGTRALREIHRVLKPGGRFVLIQSTSFSSDDDAVFAQVQKARHINQKTYYRPRDIAEAFRENGFRLGEHKVLRVRESVDHWLNSAPELSPELRTQIRTMIANAPAAYKEIRHVEEVKGELFEDWHWLLVTGIKE